MKLQLMTSRGMGVFLIILTLTAGVVGCSKPNDVIQPRKDDPTPTAKAVVINTEPKLSVDTMDYKSPATITFSASYLKNISATIGTASADNSSVVIPAGLTASTSTIITFTGEDSKGVDRTVQLPMFDNDFCLIKQAGSQWKMTYNVMSWPGGSQSGVISSDLWSYSRNFVSTGNGRKAYKNGVLNSDVLGWQYRANPNGSGTQYWDGLKWWDNSFSADGNEWTRVSTQTISGVVYTTTIKFTRQ